MKWQKDKLYYINFIWGNINAVSLHVIWKCTEIQFPDRFGFAAEICDLSVTESQIRGSQMKYAYMQPLTQK